MDPHFARSSMIDEIENDEIDDSVSDLITSSYSTYSTSSSLD